MMQSPIGPVSSLSVESRKFRMHPDLLFSVIKSQAGTLNKALLELVMNSVDAGSSRVDIALDRRCFTVIDDGKGFTERSQIDMFFETFGQPHGANDAVFGKFRMGRGQSMSFAKSDWRSGPFRMQVDIKNKGLDYTLETGMDVVKGCKITGQLYEVLEPSEKRRIELDLEAQCRYTPIPVYLNDKRISQDSSSQKWTVETDDAFITINSTNVMEVYNLGVLVANYPAHEFGVGGVVVSKKQLELNFARNDLMRGNCDVWKRIRVELKKHIPKDSIEKPVRRDENWREYHAQQMMCMEGKTKDEINEFIRMPLFTNIKGKHLSIIDLYLITQSVSLTVAPGKTLLADRAHDTKLACVLAPETFTNRFKTDIKSVLSYLSNITAIDVGVRHSLLALYVDKILCSVKDFESATGSIESEHHILAKKEIPLNVQCALRAIRSIQRDLSFIFREVTGEFIHLRQIHAMRSDSAEAFTDGTENIFININQLCGEDGPESGIAWAGHIVPLLIHEYCHDLNSGIGHTHDENFYHFFHEAIFTRSYPFAVENLFREWVKESEKMLKKRPSRAVLKQIDLDAKIQDRQEAQLAMNSESRNGVAA